MTLVRFAKLAVAVLLFGVAAVPVTCVDAHGPHSLYAPPDAQASSIAATLATHHGDHSTGDSSVMRAGSPDAGYLDGNDARVALHDPVLTSVNPGFLLLDQHATEPPLAENAALTTSPMRTRIVKSAGPDGAVLIVESPPPRLP